jgi:RHS repeat-associated protein
VEAARQDRLLSYGPFDYTYTANGELETKTNRDTSEAWLFQYDALGNLLTVGLPNGDLIDYLIDGMGRRVGKKKNGVLLKQWIYRDGLKPAAELDGSGNLVSEFVYGSKSNVPDYVRRGGATYRVISDQLGSPRYVVNVANTSDVPFTATYTSFGVATGTGLDWMPFGFAGGMYDGESGLVRFGARDYISQTGRWTSKDPIRFASGQNNIFAYLNDDPINGHDSTGLDYDPQCLEAVENECAQGCTNTCGGFGDQICFDLCLSIGQSFCFVKTPDNQCYGWAAKVYGWCKEDGYDDATCAGVAAAAFADCKKTGRGK